MIDGMNATTAPDVGAVLKRAREQQGLSVQEVADALHLRPSIVSAIEKNSFTELPGITFLKGYVKSYARLLKLSETDTLAHLQQVLEHEDAQTASNALPSGSSKAKTLTMSLLLMLVLLAGAAFVALKMNFLEFTEENGFRLVSESGVVTEPSRTHPLGSDKPRQQSISSEAEARIFADDGRVSEGNESSFTPKREVRALADLSAKVSVNTAANVNSDEALHDSDIEALNAEASSGEALNAEASDVQANQDRSPLTTAAESAEQAAKPGSLVVVDAEKPGAEIAVPEIMAPETMAPEIAEPRSDETSFAVDDTPADNATPQAFAAESAAPSVESITGEIVASFSGDCWFQIKNGDGKVVLAALKHSGDVASYKGIVPFEVVIGAVSEVSISFNGEPVDFGRFRVRNNRTDFILE
jgi:cytoskeleton protein RodZ